ncbi:MAG TPA: hypothetical protein VGG33_04555, partial [Polyangia bacterium]
MGFASGWPARWGVPCALVGALCTAVACGGDRAKPGGDPADAGGDAPGLGGPPDAGNLPDGGGNTDAAPTAEIVCRVLAPPATGVCAVTPGAGGLRLQGTVLAPGAIYRGGEVAIDETGTITCVGCDCPAPGATTVTCARGVISPGLINTHD